MENYKLETNCGDHFSRVCEKAKLRVLEIINGINRDANFDVSQVKVEFDFNDIKCVVGKDTHLDWLYRDYCNAHMMTWKQVGPDCREAYDPEIQAELDRREKAEEERQAAQAAIWKAEADAKRKAFEANIKGIRMKIRNRKGYNEWKANQKDDYGYGLAIFEYAENWAKLMQKEFADRNIENPDVSVMVAHADKCSREADVTGITGYMYGAAVAILAQHWKYGEALRKWHNKEWGHEGDGVVNPAVFTISK